MTPAPVTVVTERPLRAEEMLDLSWDPSYGAQSLFLGVIRENHEGKEVAAVTYDCFTPLAEKVLAAIAAEAAEKWNAKIAAAHRTGYLEVGQASVIIAAGCAHRAEAFEACRYVIEQIKTRLPVWKKEHAPGGEARWLDGCALRK